jgi:hypothetical protein
MAILIDSFHDGFQLIKSIIPQFVKGLNSHSVRICKCLEIVGLAESKLAAMAPAVMDCEATKSRMALLVGSAIA